MWFTLFPPVSPSIIASTSGPLVLQGSSVLVAMMSRLPAFLFRGSDPGPHMPSVGVAPLLVWQGTVELRPFLAWGWMSDRPRGPRTPELQIGVSLLSPL